MDQKKQLLAEYFISYTVRSVSLFVIILEKAVAGIADFTSHFYTEYEILELIMHGK